MKKFKLIALVLAVAMLSACFVGCEKTEKVTVNVTVSVFANDEILVQPIAVPVEAPVDDPATILDCVIHAFELNDVGKRAVLRAVPDHPRRELGHGRFLSNCGSERKKQGNNRQRTNQNALFHKNLSKKMGCQTSWAPEN